MEPEYNKEVLKGLAWGAIIALVCLAVGLLISWHIQAKLNHGGEPNPLLMLALIPIAIIGFVVTLPWSFFLGPLDKTWPISLSINLFLALSVINYCRLKWKYRRSSIS